MNTAINFRLRLIPNHEPPYEFVVTAHGENVHSSHYSRDDVKKWISSLRSDGDVAAVGPVVINGSSLTGIVERKRIAEYLEIVISH